MKRQFQGVTLIEILLVLAISAMIMVAFVGFIQQRTDEMRRARATMQMEQILNAGLAYYVAFNNWPQQISDLTSNGFLPAATFTMQNPWGGQFQVQSVANGMFYVTTNVVTLANAQVVAGRLPLAFVADQNGAQPATPPPTPGSCTSTPLGSNCTYVVSSVNIPAQNLNNATSVSFASVYHSGACVPAPVCPVDSKGNTMVPQILVIPVSVSGVAVDPTTYKYCDSSGQCSTNCNDIFDYTKCQQINVYGISSYTANAIGDQKGAPINYTGNNMPTCDGTGMSNCLADQNVNVPNGPYWRVCLYVNTERGQVNPSQGNGWVQGQAMGSVIAVTRCGPNNEPVGAQFQVWQR